MLFHSKEFLFYFLPAVFLGWLALQLCRSTKAALVWLTISSLVFYAYWNPPYVTLLISSILANFYLGKFVDPQSGKSQQTRFFVLSIGIVGNLFLLGYFKYFNFFVSTINNVFQAGWNFEKVILPLAVSFFTFQQIAYLVDSYRGQTSEHSFLKYSFFVSFFPQLIAGPIIHHSEVIPQLERKISIRLIPENLLVGISIFVVGLFKKVVIADSCGELASPLFEQAGADSYFGKPEAWTGVLAYTFQIYFDFSGYSDMAIGLSRLFGIQLPENFRAPYRATSIVEFWRRWHITLSRFLRDYLYIPLGGNRRGVFMRYRNLFVTMLLGGLWHGAGWTFLVWGGLHGLFLIVNTLWKSFRVHFSKLKLPVPEFLGVALGWILTMSCVIFAWIFFRAESFSSALEILKVMFYGPTKDIWASDVATKGLGAVFGEFAASYFKWPWLIFVFILTILLPTTQCYFRNFKPVIGEMNCRSPEWLCWRPCLIHGTIIGLMIFAIMRKYYTLAPTEFLYFNF
jgi:D-alanyl-lipoteichoic acid acyltransferase DltB (MBOAT superfamily)